jgi:amino acid adenylation domain-containing protein
MLVKWEEKSYYLIISHHHILYDGWSNGIILKEFFSAYNTLTEGLPRERPLKPKYKEFVKWVQKQDLKKQEVYWKEYLENFIIQTHKEFSTKSKHKNIAEYQPMGLAPGLKNKLIRFVKKHKITLASLLYCSWGILLQKYTNHNDVILGTPVSGRSAKIEEIENIVGLFINTLPLRIQAYPHETVMQLLQRVYDDLQKREPFENTPLVDIKKYSDWDKTEDLFNTIVVVENYPLDSKLLQENSKIFVRSYKTFGFANFDLVLTIFTFEDIKISFKYDIGLFDEETVKKFSGYLTTIISSIIEDPGKKVSEIEIISAPGKQKILSAFNNDLKSQLGDLFFQKRLFDSWQKHPGNIAVEYGERKITYSELEYKSNYIAARLKQQGYKKGSPVGIIVEDRMDFILVLMGVLTAGGVVVPLDYTYPNGRLQQMIDVIGFGIILGDRENIERLAGRDEKNNNSSENQDIDLISIEDLLSNDDPVFYRYPGVHYLPEDKIYIYFTSGTTGKPKAILGKNKSLLHFIDWEIETFNIDRHFRVSQFISLGFDAILRDIFVPLCAGGVLCIPANKEVMLDSNQLIEWIDKSGINLIHCVPSFFKLLNSDMVDKHNYRMVKFILLSGEKINPLELKRWYDIFNDRIQLVNFYGPTETTMIKTYYSIQSADVRKNRVPIGKPMKGVELILLDKDHNICDDMVIGEIYIRTPFITFGYCNDPELTREKFVQNSFNLDDPHDLIYNTGDLGRRLPDGNLELLGRNDDQVKIRGIRIEPTEIERQLLSHESIKEVVVIAQEITGIGSPQSEEADKYLCAYIVSDTKITVSGLRDYLSKELPAFLIPTYFIFLDKMPLTSIGKIDKTKLPLPDFNALEAGEGYEAPKDKIEERLVEIWSDILKIEKDRISINANFFELGGHSLKITRMAANIHKRLKVKLSLTGVFNTPTIKGLSTYIKRVKERTYASIKNTESKDYYPLSFTQNRFFILQHMEENYIGYNTPSALLLEGECDKERLNRAFLKFIERHESLRTSFEMRNGKPIQRLHAAVEFELMYRQIPEEEAKRFIENFVKPFDLGIAPLMRAGLIKIGEKRHILVFDMHHIIADGNSMGIFVNDIMALYRREELPALRIQYKDFADCQQQFFNREMMKKQEHYWLSIFKEEAPVMNLPLDFSRDQVQSFEGGAVTFTLESTESRALKELVLKESVTLYIILLAVYNLLLSKLSGREDIVVGTPVACRRHPDFQNMIGMFGNTLAQRNYPGKNKSFLEFLKEVRQRTLEAFENQEYHFEELVSKVVKNRNIGRNPLFDAMFAMRNMEVHSGMVPQSGMPGLKLKSYMNIKRVTQFDLNLHAFEAGDRIEFIFEYCKKLFKEEKIKRFIGYFKEIVSVITEQPEIKLKDIRISHDLLFTDKSIIRGEVGDFAF